MEPTTARQTSGDPASRPPIPASRSGHGSWRRRWTRVRRAVLARRRALAALLALVATWAGVRAVAAPPPETVPVVVARHDLAAGERVGADDLRRTQWPAGAAPSGAAPQPVGRVLASPLRAGEPVTDVRLVTARLAAAVPGSAVLPVRLPDAGMAALLRPGDRVDLIATDPADGSAVMLATDVLVLAVPPPGSGAGSGPVGAGLGRSGRLVVVALAPAEVTEVSGASLAKYLTVAFSG